MTLVFLLSFRINKYLFWIWIHSNSHPYFHACKMDVVRFQSRFDSKSDLACVDSYMFCEVILSFVSLAASVAPERSPARVRPHVALQLTRTHGSEVALVTLEGLFSSVHPHHVLFQVTTCNAGKLASCASVRLFLRVGSFVALQMA